MTLATLATRPRGSLSVETLLFAALFALALSARLTGLDVHPLNDAEAREALTAWRFTQGIAGAALPASPAYLTLTALAFSIFGNLDFVPRLAPALAGAALTLLPWLAREALGRTRALLTSALLVVSSLVLTASRSADGTTLAVFFVLLTAVATWRFVTRRGGVGWGVVAGGAFGASLASGPEAFIGLIALAFALPLIPGAWDALVGTLVERARLLAIAALAGFLLAATFLLLNRDGLGAAAASLVTFAQRFSPGTTGRSLTALIALVMVYDPLILAAGVFSAATAFTRAGVDRLAASAAMVVLGLIVLAGGRSQFDLVWLIVFLAPLAAHALLRLIDEFDWRRDWATPTLLGVILIALTAFAVINLAQFGEALRTNPVALEQPINWFQTPWRSLGLAVVGVVFMPLIVALIALGWSTRAAVFATPVVAVALLLVATLAGGWGQSQGRPGSPAELWWPQPVSADLARLRQTLLWSGEQAIGEGTELDVVVQGSPDGALAWALRDFSKAQFVTELGPYLAASAVVAPSTEGSTPPAFAAAYVGAPFTINPVWFPDTLFWNEQLDWLLYRRATVQYPTLTILWLREDIQAPPLVER